MGLTSKSVGKGAFDDGLVIKKQSPSDKVIAFAGNPNVGKSTIFNALTGMNQHTGNWPGKTVTNAVGSCKTKENTYLMVDIPGTYSLFAHSAEEEVARNFICFESPDITVVVCDATCLERNLNLVLQTIEVSKKVIVCVNLLDEAKGKGIFVDLDKLSSILSVPVIGTIAQKKKTLNKLKCQLDSSVKESTRGQLKIEYSAEIESAISTIEKTITSELTNCENSRWLALKLLDYDESLVKEINSFYNTNILENEKIVGSLKEAKEALKKANINEESIKDNIISSIYKKAEEIAAQVVSIKPSKGYSFDKKADSILTSKRYGFSIMLLLLLFILWLTISGANYPSSLLSSFFDKLSIQLAVLLESIGTPPVLQSLLVDGVFKVLFSVVAVMLPPMAIFFPLFTLLEDIGYLPRIAYNLDKPFKCCHACGKQALTMCMGFGCNAAGVVGCRIIDSKRERLIAIITNSLVPCNGRFPTLTLLITMFFVAGNGLLSSILAALFLTLIILLGIGATFLCSKLLSKTLLKGVPSAFTLELPPYRKPQIGKVILRSIFDRTLFVLGRAAAVAAPAGLIIWLCANISVDGSSLLKISADFLDPFARQLGLDGVILIAFVLGFPANEIVLPIIIMAYLSGGTINDLGSISTIKELLLANGWTHTTAICTMIFSLFHWPCSTTMLTIKKETGSLKWTSVSMVLPTFLGIVLCFIVASISRLI